MSKQTKITIILDQPMNEYAEEIGRSLLEQWLCFGAYSSFDQSRVTFEEIDEPVGAASKCEYPDACGIMSCGYCIKK